MSINIAPGKDGNYKCELNDATEENITLVNKTKHTSWYRGKAGIFCRVPEGAVP